MHIYIQIQSSLGKLILWRVDLVQNMLALQYWVRNLEEFFESWHLYGM